jgi:hypothetical protein
MKPEDIAIYLPCGIYGNVFNGIISAAIYEGAMPAM